tara:strand:+ start:249 stop:350 length:102 start_codon:yes stop_codon:yes gene_type:complete
MIPANINIIKGDKYRDIKEKVKYFLMNGKDDIK